MVIMHAVVASILFAWVLPQEQWRARVDPQSLPGMSLANHPPEIAPLSLAAIAAIAASHSPHLEKTSQENCYEMLCQSSKSSKTLEFHRISFSSPSISIHQLQWTSGVWAVGGFCSQVEKSGEIRGCWTMGSWAVLRWLHSGIPGHVDWTCRSSRTGGDRPGLWISMVHGCEKCALCVRWISLLYHCYITDISWLPCDSRIMVWLPWEQNTLFRSLRFAKV